MSIEMGVPDVGILLPLPLVIRDGKNVRTYLVLEAQAFNTDHTGAPTEIGQDIARRLNDVSMYVAGKGVPDGKEQSPLPIPI